MQLKEVQTQDIPITTRLSSGDPIAFQLLYNLHRKRVYAIAHKYLKCAEAAHEVVQDIFKTVWEKRERFSSVDNVDAFIYVMARNRAIHVMNLQAKRIKELSRYARTLEGNVALSPDLIVQDSENTRLLEETIQTKLSKRQREVFLMSRESQKSHIEIAEALSIARNTVNNHIKDSLNLLRSTFGLD